MKIEQHIGGGQFVFPGNNTYYFRTKIFQLSGGVDAVGDIEQGFALPFLQFLVSDILKKYSQSVLVRINPDIKPLFMLSVLILTDERLKRLRFKCTDIFFTQLRIFCIGKYIEDMLSDHFIPFQTGADFGCFVQIGKPQFRIQSKKSAGDAFKNILRVQKGLCHRVKNRALKLRTNTGSDTLYGGITFCSGAAA